MQEEAGAPLNPRGYVGKMGTKGMKLGVRSGEGAVREVAAALLDERGGGGCVPPTALVELEHRALQAGGGGGGRDHLALVPEEALQLFDQARNVTVVLRSEVVRGEVDPVGVNVLPPRRGDATREAIHGQAVEVFKVPVRVCVCV